MNRRAFISSSVLAPFSAATELFRGRRPYRQQAQERLSGPPLATGLPELDDLLKGGLPSVGVTLLISRYPEAAEALLLHIADQHLRRHRLPVAFVSGQYARETVLDQLACARTGMDRSRWRRRRWSEQEHRVFEAALDQLRSSQLHYEDTRRLRPVGEVVAGLRHLRESHGLGLVVMDNVAWFTETVEPGGTEAGAHAVGQALHDLAASRAIPVLACCRVPGDASEEEVQAPTQADLGPNTGILEHCATCLSVHYDLFSDRPSWEKTLSVRVEFSPVNSRGDCSFHCLDTRSFRVEDWA